MNKVNIKNIIKNLCKPGETLSQRAIKSGFWVFALRISERTFSLFRIVILARLLAPHDFGLMGIALLVMTALEVFSQTGFPTALIQKKENTEDYLNVSWTVLILRGFLLFAILYSIAPYAGIFFRAPEARFIIRFIGFSVLLRAFTNIGVIYFEKELEFNKNFFYQFSGTMADFIVAVSAALVLKNAWALVFGWLAADATRVVVSYIFHPYRPHFDLDLRKAKELFSFGKWVLGSTIVVFLFTKGDSLVLSKVLGITVLGFYQTAYRLVSLPCSEIGVISNVALPTYSKLQDNILKLKEAYFMLLRGITFLVIPSAAGIFILGPEFTQIFLGAKWMPMVPALKILAISAMVGSLIDPISPLFIARGKPDIAFKINLTKAATLAITVYPLTIVWKMPGTALSVLLSNCACIPIWILGSVKEVKAKIWDYRRTLLSPLISTVIMSSVLLLFKSFLNTFQLGGFLVGVFTAIVIFFGFTFLTRNILHYPIFKDMKFIFNSYMS